MPHATTSPPETIDTFINYCLPPPNGQPQPVVKYETAAARRQKYNAHPSLDAQYESFKDDETVKKEVYEKAREFLMMETGASYVHVFNHIRREPYQKLLDLPKEIPDGEEVEMQTLAMFAHVDQSDEGGKVLIKNLPLDDLLTLTPKSASRWAVINIWHPLKKVTREPLAVCDGSTVADSDLREITYRMEKEDPPGKKGLHRLDNFLWQASHAPEHMWYFKSQMDEGDCLLIKCFDARMDGKVVRRAPHSAIVTPEDAGPPRESIEIRCLVFWDGEELEGQERGFVGMGEDR